MVPSSLTLVPAIGKGTSQLWSRWSKLQATTTDDERKCVVELALAMPELPADDDFRHKTRRVRESLDNVTPADVYHGRRHEILTARHLLNMQTLRSRRCYYLGYELKDEELIRPSLIRECVYIDTEKGVTELRTHRPWSSPLCSRS